MRFLEKGYIGHCGRGDQGSSNGPDDVRKTISRADEEDLALLSEFEVLGRLTVRVGRFLLQTGDTW